MDQELQMDAAAYAPGRLDVKMGALKMLHVKSTQEGKNMQDMKLQDVKMTDQMSRFSPLLL